MCTHHLHWYEQKLIIQLGGSLSPGCCLLHNVATQKGTHTHTHTHTGGQKVNMFRMMQTQLKQAM